MRALEERLSDVEADGGIKQAFIDALLSELVPLTILRAPKGRRYTKDKLTAKYIRDYFDLKRLDYRVDPDSPFSALRQTTVYSSINKKPFKRILYGVLNATDMPEEVLQSMGLWEKFYYLAGMWLKKYQNGFKRENLEKRSIYQTVTGCIIAGIRLLEKIHRQGGYTTEPNLPYACQILRQLGRRDDSSQELEPETSETKVSERAQKAELSDKPEETPKPKPEQGGLFEMPSLTAEDVSHLKPEGGRKYKRRKKR